MRWLLVGAAIVYAVAHLLALFTDNINWDELALFDRANKTLLSGTLQAGGRPGLGVIVLLPFVDSCHDTMGMMHTARVAWSLFTFALLGGLFAFVRLAIRRTHHATAVAGGAVFLFACVPLFLRWSLHVRTDQPAIAAAVWGGVALLASRQRAAWSIAAGGCIALGYLFSQKAIYISGLVGLVAAGDVFIDGAPVDLRLHAQRLAGLVFGGVAVLAAYKLIVPLFFVPARVMSLDEGADLFAWYRRMLHFRIYAAMSSSVYPMIALLVLAIGATWRAFRVRSSERRALVVSLIVAAAGVGVARFHTASFPYFWITLGIFPVTAIALAWGGIREWLPRAHIPIAIACILGTLVVAVLYRRETLRDTQEIQRVSLGAIDQFPAALRGFLPDGGMVCRADPDPMLVYLGQHVAQRFESPSAAPAFIAEFRNRPIAFLVETHRMRSFPREVREFWDATYLPYAGAVRLAGQRIGAPRMIELVVSGHYRWRGLGRVRVNQIELGDGDVIDLAAGHYEATPVGVATGTLWLDVGVPFSPGVAPFYDEMIGIELAGMRRRWW